MLNFARPTYWNMVGGSFGRGTGIQYPLRGTRYSRSTGQTGPELAQKGPFDPPEGPEGLGL